MTKRRPKPIAVCAKCGYPVWNPDRIGLSCEAPFVGSPCRGVIRRAMRSGEWEECDRCTSGVCGAGRCERCQGTGWVLAGSREVGEKSSRSRWMLRDRLLKAYNTLASRK